MIHLVLDHSAFIPCSDKPEDEKRAIVFLGGILMYINATWYISRGYLKTLYSVLSRESRGCHPLPKLQQGLLRVAMQLLELPRCKWCRYVLLPIEDCKLKIHMVGKRATDVLKRYSALLDRVPELLNLSDDDREVIALAFKASNMVNKTIYVVTTDIPLLDTVSRVLDVVDRLGDKDVKNLKKLKPLTPRQLLREIGVDFTRFIKFIEELEKQEELEIKLSNKSSEQLFYD